MNVDILQSLKRQPDRQAGKKCAFPLNFRIGNKEIKSGTKAHHNKIWNKLQAFQERIV